MTRIVARSTLTGTSLLAAAVLLVSVLAACSSSGSTPGAGQATTRAGGGTAGTTAAAGRTSAPAATQAAGRTADPVLANAPAQLDAQTSYKFKLMVKGGGFSKSVGPGGFSGTVVNKPSFAAQFTSEGVDDSVIQTGKFQQLQGKIWTKSGSTWDLSPYPDVATNYDIWGPATQLKQYFYPGAMIYYTPAGDETVNGVLATRYTADESARSALGGLLGHWQVDAANGNSASLVVAASIWIAKSGGYPVRLNVTATGIKVGPGSDGSTNFEYVLDITKVNDAGNVITVPAS